ncbi:type I methionyl aminopeptidase [Candidatus Kaiserbacteria bacterium]|nr:type I methionyl aminopeptidase [Candidatus Kaiserbacteria bacterium]
MIAKSEKDKKELREAGKRLGRILKALTLAAVPGTSVSSLNELAERMIREGGDTPAFLHYTPRGAERPYPATLCIALNDVVVHGIPTENKTVLKDGDIIGLDTGLIHNGYIVDSGITVPVGRVDKEAQKLMQTTREALYVGIEAARVGGRVGDIGHAIQEYVKPHGYGIVRELGGHGVGRKVHEEPSIPNFGKKGKGPELLENMVIAIEPMLNEGERDVVFDDDGYTVRTADGLRSAHFEHTIIITKNGPEIITEV